MYRQDFVPDEPTRPDSSTCVDAGTSLISRAPQVPALIQSAWGSGDVIAAFAFYAANFTMLAVTGSPSD